MTASHISPGTQTGALHQSHGDSARTNASLGNLLDDPSVHLDDLAHLNVSSGASPLPAPHPF